jgi:hypothetical protein
VYRFAPLDRAGLLLGLSGAQCALVAAGIFASGLLLDAGAPPPAALVPVVALSTAALARWRGRRIHEWVPLLVRFAALHLTGRRRWAAPVPLLTAGGTEGRRQPPLPPFVGGLELVDAGAASWCPASAHAGVGAVRDRPYGTVSGSIPVRGRGFSLLERGDQDRLLQGWGDVLAGFCTERRLVSRVQVTEWAAPVGLGDHQRFLADHAAPGANQAGLESYRELLAEAAPASVGHEALVTVTVDQRRVTGSRAGGAQGDSALAALLDELRLASMRLEAANLVVGPPLSAAQTAEALRLRCDPSCRERLETRSATLAELAGLVSPHSAAPLASVVEWGHVRTDASVHRTYWVAEWPRLDVGPNWLEPFLLQAAGVRTFSLHYEPVPPSAAQRRIDRDSTRLASDEEQRSRAGFRIGARHRRTQSAVAEREAELVAGYAELAFAGFVTVTAPDEAALALASASYEQAAAQCGLELRALDGQHDLGLVGALPLGRGPAARGLV